MEIFELLLDLEPLKQAVLAEFDNCHVIRVDLAASALKADYFARLLVDVCQRHDHVGRAHL